MVLLQSVPHHVNVQELSNTIGSISGVLGVHELHVWRLTNEVVIGSVHVLVRDSWVFDSCR